LACSRRKRYSAFLGWTVGGTLIWLNDGPAPACGAATAVRVNRMAVMRNPSAFCSGFRSCWPGSSRARSAGARRVCEWWFEWVRHPAAL